MIEIPRRAVATQKGNENVLVIRFQGVVKEPLASGASKREEAAGPRRESPPEDCIEGEGRGGSEIGELEGIGTIARQPNRITAGAGQNDAIGINKVVIAVYRAAGIKDGNGDGVISVRIERIEKQ